MAELHVVSALVEKYTELLTLLKTKDAECERMREQLRAVAKTISLYKPDFDTSGLSPKRPHTRNLHFPRGMFQRVIMDMLREAKHPMSSRELALGALERHGAPTDNPTIEQFRRVLNTAMERWQKEGKVILHADVRPKRWEVVR